MNSSFKSETMNALSKVSMIFPIFCVSFLGIACNSGHVKEVSSSQPDSSSTAKDSHTGKESARPAHWTYGGEDGPEHWASLSPAYAACGQGHFQSPIDLGA